MPIPSTKTNTTRVGEEFMRLHEGGQIEPSSRTCDEEEEDYCLFEDSFTPRAENWVLRIRLGNRVHWIHP